MQQARYPDVDPDFGHWLAGFIDGEGCFDIRQQRRSRVSYTPRCTLTLRGDDRHILEEITRRTGIGTIGIDAPARPPRGPVVKWSCHSKSDVAALLRLLDRFPLRAKKAQDYALWREAGMHWLRASPIGIPGGGTTIDWGVLFPHCVIV